MRYIITILTLTLLFTGCEKITPQPAAETKPYSYTAKKTAPAAKKVPGAFFEKKEQIKPRDTVALVFASSNIGKYALDALNSINTFLIYKNSDFRLETYDIQVQSDKTYKQIFQKLKEKNINKVIALFTKDFFSQFTQPELLEDMKIFMPLVNKHDYSSRNGFKTEGIVFGAISYKEQIDTLANYSGSRKLIDLYDNSEVGENLHGFLKNRDLVYSKRVDDQNGRYKRFLKIRNGFNDSTVFLNTPIIKSSILLSQITVAELQVKRFLSTQLNYSPLILSLTQKRDRKNVIIASSIGYTPDGLLETANLTNSDIEYNWVNYSSIVGVEYLISGNIDLFKDLKLEKDQVFYPVYLYEVKKHSFEKIRF